MRRVTSGIISEFPKSSRQVYRLAVTETAVGLQIVLSVFNAHRGEEKLVTILQPAVVPDLIKGLLKAAQYLKGCHP